MILIHKRKFFYFIFYFICCQPVAGLEISDEINFSPSVGVGVNSIVRNNQVDVTVSGPKGKRKDTISVETEKIKN